MSKEKDYYHHVIRLAPEEFSDMSAFDVLCKMQHYNIPTRSLDLTSNPLVALYFACNGSKEENEKDGKVEVVKGKYYRSDIHEIQIICLIGDFLSRHRDDLDGNLSMLLFRDYLSKKKIWCGDDDFLSYLNTILKLPFIGIRPDYSNPRLKAQQGLFILFGVGYDTSTLKERQFPFNKARPTVNDNRIYKIVIPSGAKEKLREQLKRIGIDKSRILPELEHISEYIKNDLVKST